MQFQLRVNEEWKVGCAEEAQLIGMRKNDFPWMKLRTGWPPLEKDYIPHSTSINQKTHKNNLFNLKTQGFSQVWFSPNGWKKKRLDQQTFTPSLGVKIEIKKVATAKKDLIVINKIDFVAKNLTSNAGIFLLFENAKTNGIFELIDSDLVFDNKSTNKIKMNHIKTMLCGHFIGIDKLERLKLLQGDPLINEFDISVKEPETVSRFLGNFSYKTTQMFREINFKVFKKLLCKSKLTSIIIDIDSSVVNVEGH